ncbi:hypothetical protein DIPPA_05390 [Diplonema papillatum]|nr:hypothetical protein DIPPA_05390 [Diplonema papillatum]KAJ9471983.1 hypothetical protein DIPPA_05390 [Diplonema papillatum]
MEQLKFDATSAPSLSTVEQAIEDASAIDDDEKLSLTGTKDGGFGSEHSFDDGQSFVPAGEGKSEVGNDESVASLVDVEIEDEEEEEEEPEEDSYEDDDAPMPANFSEASYRGNAQLAMIPKAVHALAASALPPGMAWDRLSDTVKLQVLQSVSSEEVMIYKDRTEPFGFRVASDMTITLVLPNTAAHRAGMDRLVGTVLTHINGNPIESLADITQDLPSPIRLIVIDPTTLCPPRCVTSRACVNCFEMLADDYVFCTLCGTHREGKAVVVGTARGQKAVRKQIRSGLGGRGHVVLSKNVEASTAAAVLAAREPPTQPPAINQGELTGQFAKRAQNLNRLAFLYLGDQDMVAEYFQSILDECESIKTTSSHGSDKAGRHGPGERRMWGKRGRVAAHPFSHVFDQLLVEKDDAAGEAERLSVYAAAVESGNLAEYWERYVTHLRIERNILKRFLVGCVRSKGATADPRRKVRRKRAMVARWLAGLPPPPPVTAQGNQTEAGPVQPSDGTQSFVDHSLGNNEPFLLGTSRARDAGQQASAFEPYLARHTAPQYAFGWSKQKPCFATSPDTPSFADLPILDQPVVLLRPSSEEVHLAPLTHTTDSAVFSP